MIPAPTPVWLYFRFPLSLRLVEELLLERGVVVSYETIRRWGRKFGPAYAKELRRRRPFYILRHHLSQRSLPKPIILQFLTGILGGIASDPEHIIHLKRTAEQLFGPDLVLFTHGTGLANIRTAAVGALMGTHLRVGQEDNLFERPGVPFASNAAQVEKIVRILREFDMEPATPAETREMLQLQ